MGFLKSFKKPKNEGKINVEELVHSQSWRDREAAIGYIAANPAPQNLELLVQLLADPDWSVSKEAEDAFVALGAPGKEILIEKGLSSSNKKIKNASFRVLKKMGFENEARNALGRYYEESGNYAKAAEMYEKSGNKEKAMELRNRDREVHIYQKNVNIEVNMDSLLEYLRIHGEVVKYTCPNCGAQLEINGKNSMYFCPYCGTKVDVLSLKELIDKIL